jgi:hypothetical protein
MMVMNMVVCIKISTPKFLFWLERSIIIAPFFFWLVIFKLKDSCKLNINERK